jgi:proteasome lid subunit RPN8/RPN11
MKSHQEARRVAARLCAILFVVCFAKASASAQPSATSPAGGDRAMVSGSLTPVPLLSSLGHPGRESAPASGAPTINDQRVFKEFSRAWRNSVDGHSNRESVVLIFRTPDGGYKGVLQRFTNEYRQVMFRWNAAAIAIVHTHPDACDPKPSEHDRQVADTYGVPNITLTSSGMFMYEPATHKTSRVFRDGSAYAPLFAVGSLARFREDGRLPADE